MGQVARMTRTEKVLVLLSVTIGVAISGIASIGVRPTSHAVEPASIGVLRASSALEQVVDEPGPITVETVVGADWAVTRAGLINLEHPKAVAARLDDGDEPIQVVFHALRHPKHGLYLVDTGVERALRDDPEHAAIHGLVARAMQIEKMVVRKDTAAWLAAQRERVAGVFLTHLHTDHVSGMRDVPAATPVYVGRGEASSRTFLNFFVRSTTDAALAGKGPLREWRFERDPKGAFEGVIDVFGDASLWAIHVPGHTSGSTAFLARTPTGPVLMVGDACHTAWGWEHGVEPGTFSEDKPQSADSLARLQRFVARHPSIDVRLGHQPRTPPASAQAAQTRAKLE
jgi:N-acyl homoserine lactone hydrolase